MKRIYLFLFGIIAACSSILANSLSDTINSISQIEGVAPMDITAMAAQDDEGISKCLMYMLTPQTVDAVNSALDQLPADFLLANIVDGDHAVRIWMEPLAGTKEAQLLMIANSEGQNMLFFIQGDAMTMMSNINQAKAMLQQ